MPRYTAEQWFRGLLRGPGTTLANSSAQQWAGLTTLASGTAVGSVTTTAVDSDSLIFFTLRASNAANVSSGQSRSVEVKSITDAVAFTFGTTDGVGIARDTAVMWQIWRTK